MATTDLMTGRTGADRPAAAPTASPVAAMLVVALATAAVLQGAFYLRGQLVVGALLAVTTGVAALERRFRLPSAVMVAGLALAGWTLLRGAVVGRPLASLGPAALVLVLLTAAAAAAALDPAGRRVLTRAVTGLGLAESALGIVAVAAHWSGPGRVDEGIWRASTTLTYANAAGAVLVLALIPVLARAAAPGAVQARRSSLTAMLLLVGVLACASRGAVLALAVGVAVLLAVLGPRAVLTVLLPPLAGAALAGALLLPSMPATSRPHLLPALLGVAAGAALTLFLTRRPRWAGGLLAAGALALTGVALAGGRLPGLSALSGSRVHLEDPARAGLLHAVLGAIGRAPVLGAGSGTQVLVVHTGPGTAQLVGYAHDEWLQVLWKDGAIGLALLLLLLAAAARWLLHRPETTHTPDVLGRARWAGPLAACAALGVASGLDLLWHLPLIPLIGALLIGSSVPPKENQ